MKIEAALIPTDWISVPIPHGYANGYVGVPPEHPWFNKHYDEIECNIHGGLTYSENRFPRKEPDGLWWVGFDTLHYQDSLATCCKEYCEQELESLKEQAMKAAYETKET